MALEIAVGESVELFNCFSGKVLPQLGWISGPGLLSFLSPARRWVRRPNVSPFVACTPESHVGL